MPRVLFHLLIGCFALATTLSAQTQITTGVIQGTVMDSTGAVLPGVDVTIVNPETNLTQTRTTRCGRPLRRSCNFRRAATRRPSGCRGSAPTSRTTSISR